MYQPKIRDDLIRRLYHLAKCWDVSMTALVNVLLEKILLIAEEGNHNDMRFGKETKGEDQVQRLGGVPQRTHPESAEGEGGSTDDPQPDGSG